MTTIYFQGGRAEAARVVRTLVASLTGHSRANTEAATGVFLALGFAALSDIQGDFITKARGGTGEDGVKWAPLSPKTIAARRFGPGERTSLKKAAGLGRQHAYAPGGKDGLLSKAQLARWRKIYGIRLARFAASMPIGEAKARAAAIAWAVLKSEGAKTKLEVFGNREVEILRDTSILFNSLSMGSFNGNNYSPPNTEGGQYQIFRTIENGVIVGTNVPYARVHQEGNPARKIPARPFLPRPDRIPAAWLRNWLDTGLTAVSHALRQSLAVGSA